jgi:hypothetical protein
MAKLLFVRQGFSVLGHDDFDRLSYPIVILAETVSEGNCFWPLAQVKMATDVHEKTD